MHPAIDPRHHAAAAAPRKRTHSQRRRRQCQNAVGRNSSALCGHHWQCENRHNADRCWSRSARGQPCNADTEQSRSQCRPLAYCRQHTPLKVVREETQTIQRPATDRRLTIAALHVVARDSVSHAVPNPQDKYRRPLNLEQQPMPFPAVCQTQAGGLQHPGRRPQRLSRSARDALQA